MKAQCSRSRLVRKALAEACLIAFALAPMSAGAQTPPPPTAAPQATAPATSAPQTPQDTSQTAPAATNEGPDVAPQIQTAPTVSPTYAPGATTLPGSSLNAILSSPDINTKSAKPGDGFTMLVIPPYPNGDPNFAQATIHGHVADVTSAGQGRKAQLRLAFDTITFQSGQSQPVSGSIVKIETKNEDTTARQAIGAGAGAAVGSQTIGRILGGAFGSLVGILGGAVGGFLYGANNKANLDVATGARATIQTSTPIEVPRRQAPAS
jgi:outer membrane lipoprotein SlyB